jgi:hypothetical protein
MAIYQPYFYIIQDVRNGMYYAGAKWGKDANPSNFMTEAGYTTSSNTINKLIQQYGLDNFAVRKIRIFETPKETCYYETRFLEKVDARKNKKFYNLHNNDNIFDTEKMCFITELIFGEGIVNISQTPYWKETIRKKKDIISEKKRKTIDDNWGEDFREQLKKKKQETWKLSPKREEHSRKTRNRRIKEEANKTPEEKKLHSDNTKAGKLKRTEEERIKTSEKLSTSIKKSYENNPILKEIRSKSAKGRIAITKNGKNKRVLPNELEYYINQGWSKGCKQDRVSKNKSCLGKKAITKNGKTKFVDVSEVSNYLENGWVLGTSQKGKTKEKGSTTGRIAITKNNMTKFVESGQVDSFLEMGWVLGTSHKGKKKEKNITTGRTAIIKGTMMKYIFPDDLEKYIQEGWKPRRKSNLSS